MQYCQGRIAFAAAAAALSFGALASAQEVVKDVQVEVVRGGAVGVAAPQAGTFEFIAANRLAFLGGKPVTGAPYSGEGFSESIQTLADGTRITRKHSQKVWRDSKGRMREESTLPALGPWAAQGGMPRFVTITDPVAKVIYTLNEREKTAYRRKMPDFDAMLAGAKDGSGKGAMVWHSREVKQVVGPVTSGGPQPSPEPKDVFFSAAPVNPGIMMRGMTLAPVGKEETLGTQTMEGLKVEGKRFTHTIAAGEIGNDRALTSVSERWTSSELQTTIRSLNKDPQMGETSYRLTNISRAEPAASFFQVPADYTVKEADQPIRIEHFERKQ